MKSIESTTKDLAKRRDTLLKKNSTEAENLKLEADLNTLKIKYEDLKQNSQEGIKSLSNILTETFSNSKDDVRKVFVHFISLLKNIEYDLNAELEVLFVYFLEIRQRWVGGRGEFEITPATSDQRCNLRPGKSLSLSSLHQKYPIFDWIDDQYAGIQQCRYRRWEKWTGRAYLWQQLDPVIISILREAVLRENGIEDWQDKKKEYLTTGLQDPEARIAAATFFETLAKRRETNYKVQSEEKFDNLSKVVLHLISIYEKEEDWDNLLKIVYFTQYFCCPIEAENRFVWMAERIQESPVVRKTVFWEKILNKLIYVDRFYLEWTDSGQKPISTLENLH